MSDVPKRQPGDKPSHAEQEAELARRAEQQPDVETKKAGDTTISRFTVALGKLIGR